jgi:DNA mismatch repair ATPase MutL
VIQTRVLTFGVDLEEIIHLMRDRPSGQVVRCSKLRAMFAMRACRKSVMIGMPLNPHHMMTVSAAFHSFFLSWIHDSDFHR